jgi:subfamily B ATP-binding cassette protein MsbA
METITGIMIAILIFYSGKLMAKGEVDINNFFSFLAAMMLAYQPVRALSTLNMVLIKVYQLHQELYQLLIKKIN